MHYANVYTFELLIRSCYETAIHISMSNYSFGLDLGKIGKIFKRFTYKFRIGGGYPLSEISWNPTPQLKSMVKLLKR
jgi:hypothetical protein